MTDEMVSTLASPSPTSTNGAQYAGCAATGSPLSINTSIVWRMATARPTLLSDAILPTAPVISLTVASEATAQCDTRRARAPA